MKIYNPQDDSICNTVKHNIPQIPGVKITPRNEQHLFKWCTETNHCCRTQRHSHQMLNKEGWKINPTGESSYNINFPYNRNINIMPIS